MQPQGADVFNPAYLHNITSQINGLADDVNAVNPCAAIQFIVDEAMFEIQAEINAIEAQIAALTIIVTIPTSLSGVIKWIKNFIGPSNSALLAYIKQLVRMVAAIAELLVAIERAAARLQNCQIAISQPVVSVPLPTVVVKTP